MTKLPRLTLKAEHLTHTQQFRRTETLKSCLAHYFAYDEGPLV